MTVREYIGARYVPIFMGEWDNTATYEPLSIVMYQGASYTSRQYVPIGVPITNETFWALSGNYNAQVEAYRQEVLTFDSRIDAVENKFPVGTVNIADDAVTTAKIDDDAITNDKIADDAVTNDKIADGAVTTAKIDDDAITNDKIADGAVTPDKLNASFYHDYMSYYTPEQFGAIGDGITDDTQAFLDMLDAMPDHSLCVLQSQSYKITAPIEVKGFCQRFISFERGMSSPGIIFDMEDFTDEEMLKITGDGCVFSGIMFGTTGTYATLTGSTLIAMDGYNNVDPETELRYNIDATFDNCVFWSAWDVLGICGRNVHVTNCLFSKVHRYSIRIDKPLEATPLRGFVFDNNRFHNAGTIVNTDNILDYAYLDTFNLYLTNNMIDISNRVYVGITDNIIISDNLITQPKLPESEALILLKKTINKSTICHVCNNSCNTQGGLNDTGCFVDIYEDVSAVINISGNTFRTWCTSARNVLHQQASDNVNLITINGNNFHTQNSGSIINFSAATKTYGIISGNTLTAIGAGSIVYNGSLTLGDDNVAENRQF